MIALQLFNFEVQGLYIEVYTYWKRLELPSKTIRWRNIPGKNARKLASVCTETPGATPPWWRSVRCVCLRHGQNLRPVLQGREELENHGTSFLFVSFFSSGRCWGCKKKQLRIAMRELIFNRLTVCNSWELKDSLPGSNLRSSPPLWLCRCRSFGKVDRQSWLCQTLVLWFRHASKGKDLSFYVMLVMFHVKICHI